MKFRFHLKGPSSTERRMLEILVKKEVVSQLYGKFAFFSAMVSFRAGSPCFRVPRFCSYRYRQEKGLADPVVNRGR